MHFYVNYEIYSLFLAKPSQMGLSPMSQLVTNLDTATRKVIPVLPSARPLQSPSVLPGVDGDLSLTSSSISDRPESEDLISSGITRGTLGGIIGRVLAALILLALFWYLTKSGKRKPFERDMIVAIREDDLKIECGNM